MTQNHPIQRLKNVFHLLQSVWANIRFGFPSRKLIIIGITGTDGKTTTTSMIYHILKHAGLPVGYISTIEAKIGDESLDTGLHVTTPDPWMVPKYMRMMLAKGIKYVVLESTSSGLQQNRLWGIKFDSAAITNIKSDHLDYHGTWNNYANAKFRIFKQLHHGGLAVINKDDKNSFEWLNKMVKNLKFPFTLQSISKSDVKDLVQSIDGIGFEYKGQKYGLPVIGEYNIENALTAINICRKHVTPERIASTLKGFPVPKGRMQAIITKPFTLIIDFAHTPHALERALTAVLQIKPQGKRLITVFGCAGKRDKARREMGAVSEKYSDITILTAEDPRDEDLASINTEIFNHTSNSKLVKRFKEHSDYESLDMKKIQNSTSNVFFAFDEDSVQSRYDAIDFAVRLAKQEDIVFITGKAHEQSLCFGNTEYPWSDHEAVEEILAKHYA